MSTLNTQLRNKLERTVIDARELAEDGARDALQLLAVHHHEPYSQMSPEQRNLRNHLRAHARQLGDRQDRQGRLDIQHVIQECAYEYWHRMLFARFLAENDLLIDTDMGVAISLAECEDLAKDAGIDTWTYASRCAQHMLPQIFRPDDPLLQVPFAAEHRLKLERLLADLDKATFIAEDAIGWVYQLWQSKRKEDVNKSGRKIGADELPAVTQLFTEDYMVSFLLDNTLGAWWAGKQLSVIGNQLSAAKTEEECRRLVALPGYAWEYLRFVKGDDGRWRPAAGTFDEWPRNARELRLLDPCMGSGHFLVFELPILVTLRMAEEELSKQDAVDAVLRENLFGLELDPRCTQLAAFSLALAAWKMIGHRSLPKLNLACCGLSLGCTREEWLKTLQAGGSDLRFFMGQLYDLFQKAPTLGSLINPGRLIGSSMHAQKLPQLLDALNSAMAEDDLKARSGFEPEMYERGVAAQGMAFAAQLLASHYHLVGTNVPYLGRGKQDEIQQEFIETHYPLGKADLATAFVLRCLEYCTEGGTAALVTPQNWLFLGGYRRMREHTLAANTWNQIVWLGEHGFQSSAAAGAFTALVTISRVSPTMTSVFAGLDLEEHGEPSEKAATSRQSQITLVPQSGMKNMPDSRISLTEQAEGVHVAEIAESYQGVVTGDIERFVCCLWEVSAKSGAWEPFRRSNTSATAYGDVSHVIFWESGKGSLHEYARQTRNQLHDMHESGNRAWGRRGVAINRMRGLAAVPYYGEIFDNNVAVVVPKKDDEIIDTVLLSFFQSEAFPRAVRQIDRTIKVTNQTLLKVPIDLDEWHDVAAANYGREFPPPATTDPTQWVFSGSPVNADAPLQVAIVRLVGYLWPRQRGIGFPDCEELGSDGLTPLIDPDGIVCIPSVRGEEPAADRLLALLRKAYGSEWTPGKERELISETGSKAKNLDDWLRNDFFEQHCKLFQHRPFIWHIWDGRTRDGFHALVNYHKLAEGDGKGRQVLEKLAHSYLGEWISRQKDGVARGEGGAEDRLAAAVELQKRLLAILVGEPPFDIFVRWKPLHKQPIGWEPDINDGVRLNIRPFLADDLPAGKKGAGILRWKPNIKWTKDRGTEPSRPKEEFQWFWKGDRFTGERHNDIHLTHAEKQVARERFTAEDAEERGV
jgi:hypothetical protein